jgi:DNA-binding response OmpR family regulator
MSTRVLVVEDDAALREGLQRGLGDEGFEVECAADGLAARRALQRGGFDLCVLDLNLPGVSGVELLKELRARKLALPVLVLTARGEELDRVLLLELGADDYVVKPFSFRELVARLRALLRRARAQVTSEQAVPAKLVLGACEIDFAAFTLRRAGESLPLLPREAALLKLLVARRGEVVSREECLAHAWGAGGEFVTPRTVDNHVLRLRQKLERDPGAPRHLLTVHGVGYRLLVDPEAV